MDIKRDARELTLAVKNNLNLLIILLAALIAAVIFLWQAVATRSYISPEEQTAIINTLFLCDALFLILSTSVALLIFYLSTLAGGDLRGAQYDIFVIFLVIMVAPLAFIGCMMAFRPPGISTYSVSISALLSTLSLLSAILFIFYAMAAVQPQARVRRLIACIQEEFRESGSAGSTRSIALQQPMVSSATIALLSLLKRLSASGDTATVKGAIDALALTTMQASETAGIKELAMARSLVCDIVETGALGAESRNPGVVCHSIDSLREIVMASRREEISSMAFRGIGYVYTACQKAGDCIRASILDPWLAQVYVAIFDSTGKREALDRAVKATEQALAHKDELNNDERSYLFFAAGRVYCRLARAEKSADKALQSISLLEQAISTGEPGVLDKALINGEVGRAYVVLAASRNPVKSFKKALSAFEEAGKTLTAGISPWDAAQTEADIGNASVLLADEYYRIRRYEEALVSARSAIEHYTVAGRYFTPARSKEVHGRIMSDAGLAHTVISEIFLRSHELDNALKHVSMAISCYSSAIGVVDRAFSPEAFASLKVSIGLTNASMAEICFKEKRYDEAIAACDSAIQAYNEAVKVFEGAGKDRLATDARKHLKEASDLFNTFLMIGKGRVKPAAGETL